MGDVINLRQARKHVVRKAAEKKAAENRVLYGRTKAEKVQQQHDADRLNRQIDGAHRDKRLLNEETDRKDD
ncbi:MAG: DUF4169 family protein [Sphingobium sp.]|nr:DUF4169 family protein [Sphingobium sp.]